MLIGIDANEANVKNRVGIGRFAYHILSGIYRINNRRHQHHFQIYLKDNPLPHLPRQNADWQYQVLNPSFFWSRLALPFRLMMDRQKPRVLFSLSHYAPDFTGIPVIISIMDLSYLHFPEMFKSTDLYKLKNWTSRSARKAKKIITISNFSKEQIVKYYHKDPADVIVAYPGIDRTIYKPSLTPAKKDYILFVGTLQPRKNITQLIKAFTKLENKNDLKLRIIGRKGWLYDEIFEMVTKRGLTEKIIFEGFVSEKKLVSFYQQALCLVLPSLYEGFGIPVIEAMACGCPVLAANTSSLPEIVGQAGLLVNPQDPDSIAKAIDKIRSNEKLRQSLIKAGLFRAKTFSWEKSSRTVYNLLSAPFYCK